MDSASLIAFTLALVVAVASPGPGIAAVVARALGVGFRDSLPMILGMVLGDLVYLTAAVLGLSAIAQSFGEVFLVIRYAGAAYLLYLAYKLWTAKASAETIAASRADTPARTFLAGLSLTLGNPKVIVFYLALLPTLVDLTRLTPLGFAEIAVTVVIVLSSVATAYAYAAARARRLFHNPSARRILDRTAGTVMAGAAVAVAVK